MLHVQGADPATQSESAQNRLARREQSQSFSSARVHSNIVFEHVAAAADITTDAVAQGHTAANTNNRELTATPSFVTNQFLQVYWTSMASLGSFPSFDVPQEG